MLSLKPIVVFLAAAVSAASSTHSQSAAAAATIEQVNRDVSNIDSNVRKLIRFAESYAGGLISGIPQLATLAGLSAALTGGVVDSAKLPRPIPLDDFVGLVRHVNRTLAVDNPRAVDALIRKKREFERAGIAPFIAPGFKLLLAGHEAFSQHVLVRTPPDAPPEVKAQGDGDVELISDALRKGIRAFQGHG